MITRHVTSPYSDQASQEAARRLIPPLLRSCSLAPSLTTPLYSTTVSQALRQPLRARSFRIFCSGLRKTCLSPTPNGPGTGASRKGAALAQEPHVFLLPERAGRVMLSRYASRKETTDDRECQVRHLLRPEGWLQMEVALRYGRDDSHLPARIPPQG